MVNSCAVFGCKNSRDMKKKAPNKVVKFFPFPVRIGIRKFLKTRRICSEHFVTGQPAEMSDVSHIDWVPSMTPYSMKESRRRTIAVQRFSRCQNMQEKVAEKEVPPSPPVKVEHIDVDVPTVELSSSVPSNQDGEIQAELNLNDSELSTELEDTETQTNITDELIILNRESFLTKKGKSELIPHYTGLPNAEVFDFVLNTIRPALCQVKAQELDDFQKLLLSLMKLRLNLTYTDLADRFNIFDQTAIDVSQQTVVILQCFFKRLIHWPDRDCLKLSMPRCFVSKFGLSVVCIIDYFEIETFETDTPSTSIASNQKKEEYTEKYLIGITPYGVVSFISEGFAGDTSHSEITRRSKFLDKIQPGDVVLTNGGFPTKGLKKLFKEKGAKLLTPACEDEGGETEMNPNELELSRLVSAAVRIQIENAIGAVRQKYSLVNGPVPDDLLQTYNDTSLLDYSVQVACILTNLCRTFSSLK